MSDEVMLSGRVPEQLKKLVDADERTNQEIIESALWNEFGGKRKPLVKQQIERKRERIESIRNEKQDLTESVTELETEIRALESRLADLENAGDELHDELDTILDEMEDGIHYWEDSEKVQSLSQTHGINADELMHRLKQRAKEQGRDVWTYQFHRKDHARHLDIQNVPITEVDNVDGL